MNWIKITPETELPDGLELLVYNINNDCWFSAIVCAESRTFNLLSGSHYLYSQFTHYCIVTPPEE